MADTQGRAFDRKVANDLTTLHAGLDLTSRIQVSALKLTCRPSPYLEDPGIGLDPLTKRRWSDKDLRRVWYNILTLMILILGKLQRLFHSLLMYSLSPTMTTCLSSLNRKLLALRGITRLRNPIRGEWASANRQTTTWPLNTGPAGRAPITVGAVDSASWKRGSAAWGVLDAITDDERRTYRVWIKIINAGRYQRVGISGVFFVV